VTAAGPHPDCYSCRQEGLAVPVPREEIWLIEV
jgi:hypothetical protein